MPTGVRTRYHVAIDGKGFMLRGAPSAPRYLKELAPSVLDAFGVQRDTKITDFESNQFTGSSWQYWNQTDWSGGFQNLQWEDNGSFRDGQAIEVIEKYGQVSLQNGFVSAASISGSHSYGSHAVHGQELLFGTIKSGAAKVLKVTSANVLSTLSGYAGISAVNSMSRFNDTTLIGLSRTSGTLKTLAKYNGTAISAFRSANPIVRAVRGVGIRAYTGERVSSLSGDVLYYSTDLSTFTSAYQAGKNRKITKIHDLAGAPYFFIEEGKKVELYRYDEFAQRGYLIYTWQNLTNYGVNTYSALMVITGTSNGHSVAFAFNGARIWSLFDDQLQDSSYDFSKPFEFKNQLHLKGAFFDGSVWSPGLYGKFATVQYTPFVNFNNLPYGYAITGSTIKLSYVSTSRYEISGNVVSSEFGSQIGGVEKLVNCVDINLDNLATGQTIEVYRSVDGASTFQSIGKVQYSIDGAVNKRRLYFPSGFVTKLWHAKAVLVGPGTTTPTLLGMSFQYRPVPDLKKRWSLSLDAGDQIMLMNKQQEQRDGKALVSDLWYSKEQKRTMTFEDIDGFNVTLVSAMAATDTSARVNNTRLMPPRGRVRAVSSNIPEEMTYTSADGGVVKGISRGQKNTLARAYSVNQQFDNFYTTFITNVREQVNDTDQNTTESIAQVTLLEV